MFFNKPSISMGHLYHSFLYVYQRVSHIFTNYPNTTGVTQAITNWALDMCRSWTMASKCWEPSAGSRQVPVQLRRMCNILYLSVSIDVYIRMYGTVSHPKKSSTRVEKSEFPIFSILTGAVHGLTQVAKWRLALREASHYLRPSSAGVRG